MTEVPSRPSQQPEPDDWVDTVVSGKYRVVRLIGRGGMGRVYEVENIRIGRMMALKRIAPELTTNPEYVRRFEQEARAAGRLLHENILAVTDFDRAEDGTPYLVMELLEGKSLTTVLKTTPPYLNSQRATDLVVQACRGLAVAHAAGIVHRDLKPGNLFVCKRADGTELVKVLDFGIAKLKGEYAAFSDDTRPGSPQLGTLRYMSPEQTRGDAGVDARTDVYALGVILYQALSNKLPHLGADDVQIAAHRQRFEPIPLSQYRPDLPAQLCAVIQQTLAKNPEDRIPSVQALEQALLAAVRLPGASAADDGATRPFIEPGEPEPARPSHSLEPVGTESRVPVQGSRATRSRSIEFTAAVAFLGTLVAVASWRFFGHGSSSIGAALPAPSMISAAASSLDSEKRGELTRERGEPAGASSSSDDSDDHDAPNLADSDVHGVRNHDEAAQSSVQDGMASVDRPPKLPAPRPSTGSSHGPLAASLPTPVKKAEVSTRTSHGQGGGHGKAEPVESSRDSSGTAKDNSKVLRSDHWGDNPYTGGTKGALPRTEQR